ncbi:MAG: ATP-grasp domain-containing protein [Gammaproteobacteria bacterium]|nr:ATP-grasp domain-containing protein [Gammaproteobacteria bacterium]
MFKKLLIANRGEIACRIMRTAERLGISTAAVYSDADANAMHVEMANEAYRLGPAPALESYLHIERLMQVAEDCGADALHPGYGFLAENAALAEACEGANVTFVGPSADVVRVMGSKAQAKQRAIDAGIPVVTGYFGDDQSDERLCAEAANVGYPLLVKAALGGGGRGMRVVEHAGDLVMALEAARRESLSAFGDDRLLLERYLEHPRHIEVQVFADNHGHCIHLFERDCSAQRRHQKIVEEAPAPGLSETHRKALAQAAVTLASGVGYAGAGTVEFLVQDDEFFFMEMNTRLQVEHPVTELVTGTDLVEWQLRVAAGEPLPLTQEEVPCKGHAVEVRLYCEDTENDFLPSTGRLDTLELPFELDGIRVETGVRRGDEVTPYYDAMIAKIIAHGDDRDSALARLRAALGRTLVSGVTTNLGFLSLLLKEKSFSRGVVDTRFVSRWENGNANAFRPQWKWDVLAALAVLVERHNVHAASPWASTDNFRMNLPPWERVALTRAGEGVEFQALSANGGFELRWEDRMAFARASRKDAMMTGVIGDEPFTAASFMRRDELELVWNGWRRNYAFGFDQTSMLELEAGGGTLASPMPGQIVKVFVRVGDRVEAGAPLLVVEAMKIEHTISAPARGRVEEVFYSVGDKVDEGVELVALALEEIRPDGEFLDKK